MGQPRLQTVMSANGLPPSFEFSTVSAFTNVWDDDGSGADMDGSFYRPTVPDGWFFFGDYGQGNYKSPTGTVMVVKVSNDNSEAPALKAPNGWAQVWNDSGSGADEDGSFWAPLPPPGYVAVGHVAMKGHDEPKKDTPNINKLMCLRVDLAKQVNLDVLIWDDKGSSADEDVAVWKITQLGSIFAVTKYDDPPRGVWIPSVLPG